MALDGLAPGHYDAVPRQGQRGNPFGGAMTYIKPEIRDYGNLQQLTAATDVHGREDGSSKVIPGHHS